MILENTKEVMEVHKAERANEYLALGWVLIGMKYENNVYVLAWQKDGEPAITESAKFYRELGKSSRIPALD